MWVLWRENVQEKAKKRFHVKSAILGFIKNVLNSHEKILNYIISFKKFNSLCQSCFHKHVPFGSPKNNKNWKTYPHMNIIINLRSTKTNFYNNFDSIEIPSDDNDHHTFINSKYCNINELNALNNKTNYFGILHLAS